MVDGFAADPGTVAGRDEFRGTGRIALFPAPAGRAAGFRTRAHRGARQGFRHRSGSQEPDAGSRLRHRLPAGTHPAFAALASTAADEGLLVHSDSISGHPVFLVVRYEFTPGFDDPNTMASGGRVHYWIDDHVKVGVTASREKKGDIENSLGGADLTLRKSSVSWLKLEAGRTKGPGVPASTSINGGFNFDNTAGFSVDNEAEASAYRVDGSVGFQDIFENGRGRVTFYLQDLEAGYSAPGQATARDLTQYGGTAEMPFTDRLSARLKMDKRSSGKGLETETAELNLDYRMGEHWTLGSGVRYDSREDHSVVVPATQEEGDRTDAVVRLLYDSNARWTAYGFVQETIQATGNREDNGRVGAGGSLRLTDRFKVTGEVSEGDLGTGGKLGTEYLYSDRTTHLQQLYPREQERTDNGLLARKGNMTSGFRTRYSDSASVYAEERYTHGDVPTGLTHTAGVKLVVFDRVNFGANIDLGTLKDPLTAAELERKALGVSVGYGFDKLKLASAVEYRVDNIRAARYQLLQTDLLAVEKQFEVPTVRGLAAHRQIQLRRE